MASSGNNGSTAPRSPSGLTALKEVKRAEAEVREKKREAEQEADETLTQARKEARQILDEAREEAEDKAERIVLEAREEAQREADEIVEDARDQASELRDVSETRLEEATDAVLQRFKKEIGGV